MDTRVLRLALADDDVLLREGLASLLERHGYAVTGQVGDAAELLTLVRDDEPDLVVTDIRMPPAHATDGLDAALVIRKEFPAVRILLLSAHVEVEHAMELLATGDGIGYLLKSRITDVTEFMDAVERVARGGSVVDPGLVQELVGARRKNDPLAALTPREREVLALMAEGFSNSGIARRIYVTENTVEKHVNAILDEAPARGIAGRPSASPCRHHVPGGSIASSPLAVHGVRHEGPDRFGGELRLRHEADGRARCDEIGELGFRIGRDQDDVQRQLSGQRFREIETALRSQVDVDQDDVRAHLGGEGQSLASRCRRARDHGSLPPQQIASGRGEVGVVIDDDAAEARHDLPVVRPPRTSRGHNRKMQRPPHCG